MNDKRDETAEETMLLTKQAELLELIRQHFTIQQGRKGHQLLVCNQCGKPVTWVTRHLAERHDMDVEVWRLPRWSDHVEVW